MAKELSLEELDPSYANLYALVIREWEKRGVEEYAFRTITGVEEIKKTQGGLEQWIRELVSPEALSIIDEWGKYGAKEYAAIFIGRSILYKTAHEKEEIFEFMKNERTIRVFETWFALTKHIDYVLEPIRWFGDEYSSSTSPSSCWWSFFDSKKIKKILKEWEDLCLGGEYLGKKFSDLFHYYDCVFGRESEIKKLIKKIGNTFGNPKLIATLKSLSGYGILEEIANSIYTTTWNDFDKELIERKAHHLLSNGAVQVFNSFKGEEHIKLAAKGLVGFAAITPVTGSIDEYCNFLLKDSDRQERAKAIRDLGIIADGFPQPQFSKLLGVFELYSDTGLMSEVSRTIRNLCICEPALHGGNIERTVSLLEGLVGNEEVVKEFLKKLDSPDIIQRVNGCVTPYWGKGRLGSNYAYNAPKALRKLNEEYGKLIAHS